MNNVFNELPWSVIKVLRYIVKCYNNSVSVDAISIREHFNFRILQEQPYLEILEKKGFIDNTNRFPDGGPWINGFRVTAKSLTAFESFKETIAIYLISSMIVPALLSIVVTLITLSIKDK